MPNITRYDPFELMTLHPNFNRLFSEPFFKDFDFAAEGTLPLDVRVDTDGQVLVEASLPGFKKEEIEVELVGGQLTITAQRKKDEEERRNGNKFYRKERYFGSVSRTIALPGA
ncbi:MAG: Hsp20/alpha crystallin family protein, partial [Planctomycetes bacterium]|nr:Hsp20/alpha crystallin family protein [Planctomycetota bacterium]